MERGYIKLYRSIESNDLFIRDKTSLLVFIYILISADWKTGELKTGRKVLAAKCNLNPSTTYASLKRLQKMNMISMRSNNQMTTIYICNWRKYQMDDNNGVNAQSIENDTIQEVRSKKNKNNTYVEAQGAYDRYIKSFNKNPNTYKLTPKRKAKLQARLKDVGEEILFKAIDNVSRSAFHNGDNDRGWKADLDWIIKSYEQVERLANIEVKGFNENEPITNIDLSTAGLSPEEVKQMEGR